MGGFRNPPLRVFVLSDTLLKVSDASFELGDAAILFLTFLSPAAPDPTLELDRTLENPPVLGLDLRTLFLDTALHVLHTPPV